MPRRKHRGGLFPYGDFFPDSDIPFGMKAVFLDAPIRDYVLRYRSVCPHRIRYTPLVIYRIIHANHGQWRKRLLVEGPWEAGAAPGVQRLCTGDCSRGLMRLQKRDDGERGVQLLQFLLLGKQGKKQQNF